MTSGWIRTGLQQQNNIYIWWCTHNCLLPPPHSISSPPWCILYSSNLHPCMCSLPLIHTLLTLWPCATLAFCSQTHAHSGQNKTVTHTTWIYEHIPKALQAFGETPNPGALFRAHGTHQLQKHLRSMRCKRTVKRKCHRLWYTWHPAGPNSFGVKIHKKRPRN